MLSIKRKNIARSTDVTKAFSLGDKIYNFPVLFIYTHDKRILIGFTVSKRKVKKAVDRNRIKRIMKAQYQKQATGLTKGISGVFLYLSHSEPKSKLIYSKIAEIIETLNSK